MEDLFGFCMLSGLGVFSVGFLVWVLRYNTFPPFLDELPQLGRPMTEIARHNFENIAADMIRGRPISLFEQQQQEILEFAYIALLRFLQQRIHTLLSSPVPDWIDWYPLGCGCDSLLQHRNMRLGAATTKRDQAPPHLEILIGVFSEDGKLVSKGSVQCVHPVANVPILDGDFPQDEQLAKTLTLEYDLNLARQIPPETHHQALKMYVEGLALEGLRDMWVNSVVYANDASTGVGFNNLMRSQLMRALTAADRQSANAYLHEILFRIVEQTTPSNQSQVISEVILILPYLFHELDLQGEDFTMLREISPFCCDAIYGGLRPNPRFSSMFTSQVAYAWEKRRQARRIARAMLQSRKH
jgi:hypothetical protein